MRSSLARLTEIRRALPLAAAALLVGALLVPMWKITLTAPQYPGQELLIELYAYPRLGGDFAEVQGLNKYAGFHYPDPVFVDPNYAVSEAAIDVPEWLLGPVVFVGLALTGAFVAFAPTASKLKAGLTAQFVGTVTVFVGTFAFIQYRLHQAGHSLDPDAPLRGIEPFTPPLLGPYEVANISGFAWFGPGGYMTVLAVLLLATAYLARDIEATVADLPRLALALPGAVRDRVASGEGGDGGAESTRKTDRDRDVGEGDHVG
jgi:hypothetical protein